MSHDLWASSRNQEISRMRQGAMRTPEVTGDPSAFLHSCLRVGFLIAILGWNQPADASEATAEVKDHLLYIDGEPLSSACIANLRTELNGDNHIAAIYVTDANLRGCMRANIPGPENSNYSVSASLPDNTYMLRVCESVQGSLRNSCDQIIVRFEEWTHHQPDGDGKVLVLKKIGEWETSN